MHCCYICNQAFDRAYQSKRCIDHMGRQIAQSAVRQFAGAPGRWGSRIGAKILGMLAAKPCWFADFTRFDQSPGELRRGCSNVVETDHVRLPGRLRRGNHCAAVIQRCTKGFFAKDRLACGERRQCNVAVQLLRRRDDDCFNQRVRDHRTPIGCGAGKTILCPILFGRFYRSSANHFKARAQAGCEYRANGSHGNGVGLAHISAADDANSDGFHGASD